MARGRSGRGTVQDGREAMIALVKYAEGRGNLELRDVPVPEVGEGDVLIEVKAAGICGSDIGFADEEKMSILHPPVVLGHEFAGVVSKVGSKVKGWKPGDRVVSDNTGYVCGTCYACSIGTTCFARATGAGVRYERGFTKFVRPTAPAGPRTQNALPHPGGRPLTMPRSRPSSQRLPSGGAGGSYCREVVAASGGGAGQFSIRWPHRERPRSSRSDFRPTPRGSRLPTL
jgi:hypothetical protein